MQRRRSEQASRDTQQSSIELLMFTSEEPTRFGIGCLGSRLLSGSLNPGRAKTLTDSDVQSLDQVRAAGFTGELDDVSVRLIQAASRSAAASAAPVVDEF